MPDAKKSDRWLPADLLNMFVWIGLILGIFLPYITAPIFGPIINVPWSLFYGILPFLLTDVLGSVARPAAHYLRIVGVILSPVLLTYLLLRLIASPRLRHRRRLITAMFVVVALMTVPSSLAIEKLDGLPFYQRYVSF